MRTAWCHFRATPTNFWSRDIINVIFEKTSVSQDIGFEGKDILEYVKEQQKLDREERAAWREAQKMQAQADIELAKIRAEADRAEADRAAEEKRRADEIQIAQIEAAKEQAKIEAEKELALKELELKAQQSQASTSPAATPPPRNKDAKSPKLPSFIDEKDELDSYLLRFEHQRTPEVAAVLPL